MTATEDLGQQFCTFWLGEHLFGIDVVDVREVLRGQQLTPVPLAPDVVCGLLNLRGEIVTAIDLRRRLGLPERPEDRCPVNLVVRVHGALLCFVADAMSDVMTAESDRFEPPPETLPASLRSMIRGAFQRETGLLLILDCARVADVAS